MSEAAQPGGAQLDVFAQTAGMSADQFAPPSATSRPRRSRANRRNDV
jgi:hypothetical protein